MIDMGEFVVERLSQGDSNIYCKCNTFTEEDKWDHAIVNVFTVGEGKRRKIYIEKARCSKCGRRVYAKAMKKLFKKAEKLEAIVG